MSFRHDRLVKILAEKKWDTARLSRETGISPSQLGRYLKGEREPAIDALAKLVMTLELDADFLIDTDVRYANLSELRAAAHMSLDRYCIEQSVAGRVVPTAELEILRDLADELSEPPVWIVDWRKAHEQEILRASRTTPSASTIHPRRHRRGSPPS